MTFPRTQFVDGRVYHDYHFNAMQLVIAQEIKEQDVLNRYDLMLATSEFKYSFVDPAIDETLIDRAKSNVFLDSRYLQYCLPAAASSTYQSFAVLYSKKILLPEIVYKAVLLADVDVPEATSVSYGILVGEEIFEVEPGVAVQLPPNTNAVTIRITLNTTNNKRTPTITSYGAMFA